jgi:hypothetical protein
VAISIPRTCPVEIIPSAFVNEKCVSAFEFNRMTPKPLLRSGGSTMGKTLVQSSFSALKIYGRPPSAKLAISARYGLIASERLSPKQRF